MFKSIYSKNIGLFSDLYHITMAYGYWKRGRLNDEAVFNMYYRSAPFSGDFAIACGLEHVIEFISGFEFESEDIEYLASLKGNNNNPLFEIGFLDYLEKMRMSCDIDAVEEGRIVLPQEPMLRVKGLLIQCQLLEAALLNTLNFQTLIATKAARICLAAKDAPVLEFGLRRAHGIDGGLSASRAAYIGGCAGTSNVLAGKVFGIPVKGTHAHSWVMSFESEAESFEAYAEAMPDNCVFLVDTYNTEEGLKHAINIGKKLRLNGHNMTGVRLDSGNLRDLSIKARVLLDDAGFQNALIVGSSDLDEFIVSELKQKGAVIDVWGVGTKLVTGHPEASLGGVYKLSALRKSESQWEYRVKVSDDRMKTSNPGILQTRRFFKDDIMIADCIYDIDIGCPDKAKIISLADSEKSFISSPEYKYEDLLKPIFRNGKCVYSKPDIHKIREQAVAERKMLAPDTLKLKNSQTYITGLEENLYNLKIKLLKRNGCRIKE